MLTGITIALLHKLLKPSQLIDHSGVVPANSQASNKDLFGIISLMVSTISKQETYLYLLQDMYFHFQTIKTGCFFFNLSMDGLQLFSPFNSRFLDVDMQIFCEKSALGTCILYFGFVNTLGILFI
jgi:hypothetical protein